MNPTLLYLMLAIPLWLFTVWAATFHQLPLANSWGSDYWEHAAALHTWPQDLLAPSSPHVASSEGSPRYMPFYFLVSALAARFGLASTEAMSVAGIVSITILLIAVPLFFNRYFGNRYAAPVALVVLFCAWGAAWRWSNVYQLSNLYYVISYPSFFVFSGSFLGFWLLTVFLRDQYTRFYLLAALSLLVALLFSSHPLTGAVSVMAFGLMALLEPGTEPKRRIYAVAAIGIGALLVELWPYFSTWKVVLGTSGGETTTWVEEAASHDTGARLDKILQHRFYDPKEFLVTLGPALVGLPLVFYYLVRWRFMFAVAGAVITLGFYVLNLFFSVPLGHRFLLFGIFFMHILIVALILEMASSSDRGRKLAIFALVGILVPNLVLAAGEYLGYSLRPSLSITYIDKNKPTIPDHMEKLAEHLTDSSVTLAPDALGWPIPAFRGKVVSNYHRNPMIHDDKQRRIEVSRFFDAGATAQERADILHKYGVTHVFYNPAGLESTVLAGLDRLEGSRHEIYDLRLIALKPGAN